ncbi:surfeit locus protein 2 [Brachionichthys hirsutus]|uniref:surfeit locus protein 2 n=1 Tax=Brachionichthys hirsutus TaxID=412623 RepID=UPI00360461C7
MDELPADVKAFLLHHPSLQLTDGKKIKCALNGHELPCNLTELQKFIKGKTYEKQRAKAEFDYGQYEPNIVPSTKQPNQLFCKLTLRHLNQQPHDVLRHVNGKRFKKALSRYEECMQQGIAFVPARLAQKKPKVTRDEFDRGKPVKRNGIWEPSTSDEDHRDSEDSMSDLYPAAMFSLKDAEGDKKEEENDFQTDDDEEMEVDKKVLQKRKKAQGVGLKKKFRNNHWKSGRKKQGKVQSKK